MDLIASFSTHKINTFHFLTIDGIMPGDVLFFLFDTGSVCSVLGVNSLFPDGNSENEAIFKQILKEEILIQHIAPRTDPLKTANNQKVTTYPCVCHNVSIENMKEQDFYFEISTNEINIPLLGSSFIDDCAYHHTIDGPLNITGIKEEAGAKYYDGRRVLDFNSIITRFEKRTL